MGEVKKIDDLIEEFKVEVSRLQCATENIDNADDTIEIEKIKKEKFKITSINYALNKIY